MRDVLHADDMKRLYLAAIMNIEKARGQVFNIGGGVDNSLSLLELFDLLNDRLNVGLSYLKLPVRESDQRVFIADLEKVSSLLGWRPSVSSREGIYLMIEWVRRECDNK